MKIVVSSGYFDPLHIGHLECLELAKQLGDKLIVIVNSDLQAKLKKGESFMKQEDRMKIISALKCVDEVFLSIDKDSIVAIPQSWKGTSKSGVVRLIKGKNPTQRTRGILFKCVKPHRNFSYKG